MNVVFNEISLRPYADSSHELKDYFLNLVKTFKRLKNVYNVDHIIFPINIAEIKVLPDLTISEWFNELGGLQKSQILSIIRKPYSNDVLEDNDEEIDTYIFSNSDLRIVEENCIGLGVADICETASVSLNTDEFWKRNRIPFHILDYDSEKKTPKSVPNCCLQDLTDEFVNWVEGNIEIELVPTDLKPEQKSISLRDDHGKNILQAFAKRIRISEYVISIVNSLPFNSNTSRFIRECYSDGRVEIVLHWEDKGFGMVIQTTGRTKKETDAIAEILKDKYDR